MLRTLLSLGLLVLLAACGAPAASRPAAVVQPARPSPMPSASVPAPTPSPSPAPAEVRLADSALLARWNRHAKQLEVVPVDPATGRELAGYAPVPIGTSTNLVAPYAFAVDRAYVALVESNGRACEPAGIGSACSARADALHVIDTATWRAVRIALPANGWAGPIVFDSPSARVAVAYSSAGTSTLLLYDAQSGALHTQRALPLVPSLVSFSGDAAELLVYGQPRSDVPGFTQPDPPRVLTLDAATLDTRWEHTLDQVLNGFWCSASCDAGHTEQVYAQWSPATALAPDRSALYIVHADAERMTTVDWSRRNVHTAELGGSASWLELLLRATAGTAAAKDYSVGAFKQAVISPDGTRLYVLSEALHLPDAADEQASSSTPLGLQVIDVARATSIARYDTDSTSLRLSPDGAHVLLERWGATHTTEVLDAASLERVAWLEQWDVRVTQRLDGTPLVLGKRLAQGATHLAQFDPGSFALDTTWTTENRRYWVVPGGNW